MLTILSPAKTLDLETPPYTTHAIGVSKGSHNPEQSTAQMFF